MNLNEKLVADFERNLDPQNIAASKIPARLIGFGEISSIIELEEMPGLVLKRMPMFPNKESAHQYLNNYKEYCQLLTKAGLQLPEDDAVIVEKSSSLSVLYFAQQKFNPVQIGNKVLQQIAREKRPKFIDTVIHAIYKVWDFNASQSKYQLAIDAQISNWAYLEEQEELYFIDTSTPLFKIHGVEQLDPELILTSAPSFGKAIIRKFFLADVMNRYYDEHSVNVDVAANLYKEKLEEYIPIVLEKINARSKLKITEKEVSKYYKEDKFIWSLFLALRKTDRWLHQNFYNKQYQFILPGRIER